MSEIRYTIEFFNEWHCGSGLAAGAGVDSLVIKDRNNLPFVPGKTVKGLVRNAVEELLIFYNKEDKDTLNKNIIKTFGFFDEDKDTAEKGTAFFTNAELSREEQKAIRSNKLSKYMYRSISSTAIDKEGIAEEHSLRNMETVVPCSLQGKILEIPDENVKKFIIKSLGMIKRIGQNSNRGLGRCSFNITEGGEK